MGSMIDFESSRFLIVTIHLDVKWIFDLNYNIYILIQKLRVIHFRLLYMMIFFSLWTIFDRIRFVPWLVLKLEISNQIATASPLRHTERNKFIFIKLFKSINLYNGR